MIKAAAIRVNGVAYTGRRHNEIISYLVDLGFPTPIGGEQGFIDDVGNFLDRQSAGEHATPLREAREQDLDRIDAIAKFGAKVIENPEQTALQEARDRGERYRKALQNISDQPLRGEMYEDSAEDADWEAGYEAIVKIARAALAAEGKA